MWRALVHFTTSITAVFTFSHGVSRTSGKTVGTFILAIPTWNFTSFVVEFSVDKTEPQVTNTTVTESTALIENTISLNR